MNRKKIIFAISVLFLLAVVFVGEGFFKKSNKEEMQPTSSIILNESNDIKDNAEGADLDIADNKSVDSEMPAIVKPTENNYSETGNVTEADEGEKVYQPYAKISDETEIKSQLSETPEITEEEKEIKKDELICTLSVRCDTILENMDRLKPDKAEIIPADGIILSERQVIFYEGESVFNILQRELKRNKIHMEFVNTPGYGSAYIEGIANIYEFDCGELSGWTYRVNGETVGYGSNKYILKNDDIVEWVYSCDLERDIT